VRRCPWPVWEIDGLHGALFAADGKIFGYTLRRGPARLFWLLPTCAARMTHDRGLSAPKLGLLAAHLAAQVRRGVDLHRGMAPTRSAVRPRSSPIDAESGRDLVFPRTC
jgi:hypothetical protein